jgi:hypothetical protein
MEPISELVANNRLKFILGLLLFGLRIVCRLIVFFLYIKYCFVDLLK